MRLFQRTGMAGTAAPIEAPSGDAGHAFGARGGAARRSSQPRAAPPAARPEPPQADRPIAPEPSRSAPEDPVQVMAARLPGLADLSGLVAACLADRYTGFLIAALGDRFDPEAIAASSAQTLRAELHAIESLGLDDRVEEMLVTLDSQIHLLRPLESVPGVILHLVLDRARANLGLVRLRVRSLDPGVAA